MSADWYFIKRGFFNRQKRVGPICELDLLKLIEKGDVIPDTMLSSESKTKGKWMPMKEIRPAIKHYKQTHPNAA